MSVSCCEKSLSPSGLLIQSCIINVHTSNYGIQNLFHEKLQIVYTSLVLTIAEIVCFFLKGVFRLTLCVQNW